MKRKLCLVLITILIIMSSLYFAPVRAATVSVWQSGNTYYWDGGSSSDLATAIMGAMGSGNVTVDVRCGGNLSQTVNLQPGTTLKFNNNRLVKTHSGTGFHREGTGNIAIYDLILDNSAGGFGIRTSRASDLRFENISINGGGIGIRVDSHPSRPYEEGRWVYNLTVKNCRFENCGSHGLETYGVDGCTIDGIVARNNGECGVLLNKTINGTVGTVDSYRSPASGGYAGFRLANYCENITANYIKSVECGRGIFILTGSKNVLIKDCYVTGSKDIGIWFQDVENCRVETGYCTDGINATGSGSYICVGGYDYGTKRIQNRSTGMYLDGLGKTTNGEDVGQWANTNHSNAKWKFIQNGNYYFIENLATGMRLDGYGRTTNGDPCAQYKGTTHSNAQWRIIQSNGYYFIENRSTGMRLDGYGRTTNGDSCAQYKGTTHANAQWKFVN